MDFFGGEPLINFGVVERRCGIRKRAGKKDRQGNSLYHDDKCLPRDRRNGGFYQQGNENLVVSIDGRWEVHDGARKNAAGEGSYDKVLENAKKLIAGRGDREYYIRGTYTRKNLDFTEDVRAIVMQGSTRSPLSRSLRTTESLP